ncbi:MAG: peptidoglycan D,D-transpeptidase FtsI family protein [Fervidobacterium sp.]
MKVQRYKILYFFIATIITIFIARIWINIAGNQYAFNTKIPALRGNIYDCKGRLLSTSEIVYTAYLDLRYLKSIAGNAYKRDPDFIKMLSNFGLKTSLESFDNNLIIKLGSFSNRDDIQKKVPVQYLRFVSVEPEERRIFISEYGLNFIVGKTEQRYGISGAEAFFDKILRPIRDGTTSITYSGFFGRKAKAIKIEPENGKDVVLSIDSFLQKDLYKLVNDYEKEKQATEVGIVVMESESGKLRVLLTTQSWPSYYMGYVEPGSTIKPILFSAALELGIVKPESTFYCPGYVQPIDGLSLKIKDLEKHRDINLYDGLVHSCNVVSILTVKKLVESYGQEKIYEILTAFGFGKETGLELPGEIPGKLSTPDKWYKADWAFLGIGQSIGVTPVQLVAAFNAVINDGIYVQPSIDEKKDTIKKRIISSSTSRIIKEMLRDVIDRGTGVNAKIEGIEIYGKTGTAQKSNKKEVTALFIGQAKLKKNYTILVWVDSPQMERLSSVVAAPLFKKVVEKLEKYISEEDKNNNNEDLVNLRGWSLEEVVKYAKENSLKLVFNNYGLYVTNYYFEITPEGTQLRVEMSEKFVLNGSNNNAKNK